MAIHDQERILEEKRLQQTLDLIKERMDQIEDTLLERKEEIKLVRRNFWEDLSVNNDNWADLLESYADITQKAQTLAIQERQYGVLEKMYKRLQRMADSPYFGRMDFLEEGQSKAEQIYIGIATLWDEDREQFIVYDWRAPISSLYYDASLGPAEYETPVGVVRGEVTEKRQYVIRYGKMLYMFDTGDRIADELLQQILGTNADTQMRSIVATIQKEQNVIIRDTEHKMVVVHGVAGSGKTSVALQRIAYLLYRYRDRVTANNLLLLSPNPLFRQYISNVLPELGESNIPQSTLHEYIEERLGKRFQIEHPYDHLEKRLQNHDQPEREIDVVAVQWKGSLSFYTVIERYISYLQRRGMRFRPVRFQKRDLVTEQEMIEQFYSYDENMRLPNRIERLIEWLLQRIKEIETEEIDKDWVLDELNNLSREQLQQAYLNLRKQKGNHFSYHELEEEELRKMVLRTHFQRLRKWVKQCGFIDYMKIYRQLFESTDLLRQLSEGLEVPNNLEEIAAHSRHRLTGNFLPYEDSAPMLLLKELINGFRTYLQIFYVLVDEAQDYSPFQFKLITRLFPRAKWTILGDNHQAIWSGGIQLNTDIPKITGLEESQVAVYPLLRGYRSTKEITEFSKRLLLRGDDIIPFNRSGEPPEMCVVEDEQSLYDKIIHTIERYQTEGMKTIAILCKHADEVHRIYSALSSQLSIQRITLNTTAYDEGILILPVYLAKGLEFDAVIIPDASKEMYKEEQDRYTLYTAVTRAMHRLSIFAIEELSTFLTQYPS